MAKVTIPTYGLPLGLTGATGATRYVGATASGAPAAGTFAIGDFVLSRADGAIYVCLVAGTPGTWTNATKSISQGLANAQGLGGETFDRSVILNTGGLTAQQLEAGLVYLKAGMTVTNLHIITSITGVGTGYGRMGLYDVSGNRLAITGDLNATFTGTAGLLTCPLAAPYPVVADGGYYLCVLTDLSVTQPTVRYASGGGFGSLSQAIGSGALRYAKQAAQAAFPATATLANQSSATWFGWS